MTRMVSRRPVVVLSIGLIGLLIIAGLFLSGIVTVSRLRRWVGLGSPPEPALQQILDTLQIPVNVAAPEGVNTLGRSSLPWGDEIPAQRFVKAGSGAVSVEPIAIYGPIAKNPVVRFGWYTSGSPTTASEVFSITNEPPSNGQTMRPSVGKVEFDPGEARFGIYSTWPNFPNQPASYSEDAFNTWETDPQRRHKVRVYPLKEANGTLVRNAFVVATEETLGFDYQDIVVILRNVQPVAPELVLEFDRTYPGTLFDRNGKQIGFVTTQRNKNDNIVATNSFDPAQLDLDTAVGVLRVNSTPTSSAQGDEWNTLINGLQLPFDASSTPFTITTRIMEPIPKFTTNSVQAGLFFGPDQDNYLKVIILRIEDANVLQFYYEQNGVTQSDEGIPLVDLGIKLEEIEALDLTLTGTPATGEMAASYHVVTAAGEKSGAIVAPIVLPADVRSQYFTSQVQAGLTVSARNEDAPTITVAIDRFAITSQE